MDKYPNINVVVSHEHPLDNLIEKGDIKTVADLEKYCTQEVYKMVCDPDKVWR